MVKPRLVVVVTPPLRKGATSDISLQAWPLAQCQHHYHLKHSHMVLCRVPVLPQGLCWSTNTTECVHRELQWQLRTSLIRQCSMRKRHCLVIRWFSAA